jgi:hypothetical protein
MLFVERQMYDDLESDDGSDGDGENPSSKKKGSSMKGSEIKYEDFFRGGISLPNKKGSVDAATSSGGKKRSKAMKIGGEDSDDDSEDGSDDFEGIEDEDDSEGDFDEVGGDDYDFGDDEAGEGERSSGTAAVRQRALTTHEKRNLKMASQIAEIESTLSINSSDSSCPVCLDLPPCLPCIDPLPLPSTSSIVLFYPIPFCVILICRPVDSREALGHARRGEVFRAARELTARDNSTGREVCRSSIDHVCTPLQLYFSLHLCVCFLICIAAQYSLSPM